MDIDIDEWISLCVYITPFIGALMNICLWVTTSNTLKEVKKQNINIRNSLQSETLNKIHIAHQNIYKQIFDDKELLDLFSDFYRTSNRKTKKYMLYTLLFNHNRTIYSFYVKGFLEVEDWKGMKNDIKDFMLNLPGAKERWDDIKQFYTEDYRKFIDGLVNDGK